MNHVNYGTMLTFSIALASLSAAANPPAPTTIGCSPKAVPANLAIEAVAFTSIDDQYQPSCPLLEEKKYRKFVDKYGAGTTFAHPAIPGYCLSGIVTEGTLEIDGTQVSIDLSASQTESAQRLLPVPLGQELNVPGLEGQNLFAISNDGTLQAGAAMTAVHLEGEDEEGNSYKFDLLLDDHFLITQFGEDTEDFLVIGSRGDYKKTNGRLTGRGQIIQTEPVLGIMFNVTGTLCLE